MILHKIFCKSFMFYVSFSIFTFLIKLILNCLSCQFSKMYCTIQQYLHRENRDLDLTNCLFIGSPLIWRFHSSTISWPASVYRCLEQTNRSFIKRFAFALVLRAFLNSMMSWQSESIFWRDEFFEHNFLLSSLKSHACFQSFDIS